MMYDVPATANEVPRLEDYLQAIRSRWMVVLFTTVFLTLLAYGLAGSRTPVYEAESRVVINPSIFNATGDDPAYPVLEREREVIASNSVLLRSLEVLADTESARDLREDLDVSFVNDSDTLELTFTDPDPVRAMNMVNTIADSYIELREEASLDIYNSQISSLQNELAELDERLLQISGELGRKASERTAIYATPASDPTRQTRIDAVNEEMSALNAERNGVNSSITLATRDLRQLERDLASRRVTAEVIEYADVPENAAGPSRSLLTIAGLLLGVMGGVALAFVLDRLDRTAKDSADVETAIGTTVLGNIPKYGLAAQRSGVVMLSSGKSARIQRVREAYRRIRASLQFLQSSKNVTSIVVTSALPGEGKSSVVANLGVAVANAGSRVVIVSADLRRPMLDKFFNVSASKGLSDYLAEPKNSGILVPVPAVAGLVLLPVGPLPTNPSELLGSKQFGDLISELSDQFDLVLIDMPPILSAADAGAASVHVDGVIIVVDSQRTDTESLLRVRATLERSGGKIVGAILNKDSSDSGLSIRRDRYSYEKVASQR